ncbi:MAG: 7-carboxy-7-deazaguanine synthase [Firmicutes bacterium]|nr:7-carboxy-7-deazaguanine synthase [Bacillota bacterium]
MIEQERYFRGLQKTSVIDFPATVACVLFAGGCNFRCPYCHNRSLVQRTAPVIGWDDVFAFLRRRRQILDGVCISGGEPTLAPFLPVFLRQVKELGFKVKLDTNGYEPEALGEFLRLGLLDYVAMDVKNSPGKYAATCGLTGIDQSRLRRSIALIKASGVPYEFRTTVSCELTDHDDIVAVADFVGGGQHFALQAVNSASGTLSGRVFVPPTQATIGAMKECLMERFDKVSVRSDWS